MTFTNKDRAARIGKVLRTYETDDTFVGCLIDILADARHWCDQNGHSFADLDRQAYQHYLGELADETGGAS
jgi:hypothetical protein